MTHTKLILEFEREYKRPRFSTYDLILEIILVCVVCGMKTVQAIVPVGLNVMATIFVSLLMFCYFYNFNSKRSLDKGLVDVVMNGFMWEKDNHCFGKTFFKQKILEFKVFEKIFWAAVFDCAFIYFFSVSLTQTLKSIEPEIVAKLGLTTHLSTFFIISCLIYCYYIPFRPLLVLKKELSEGNNTY